jgi:hypothetical protein
MRVESLLCLKEKFNLVEDETKLAACPPAGFETNPDKEFEHLKSQIGAVQRRVDYQDLLQSRYELRTNTVLLPQYHNQPSQLIFISSSSKWAHPPPQPPPCQHAPQNIRLATSYSTSSSACVAFLSFGRFGCSGVLRLNEGNMRTFRNRMSCKGWTAMETERSWFWRWFEDKRACSFSRVGDRGRIDARASIFGGERVEMCLDEWKIEILGCENELCNISILDQCTRCVRIISSS